VEPRK